MISQYYSLVADGGSVCSSHIRCYGDSSLLSGYLWQPNYFSIGTSSFDHATNSTYRMHLLLSFLYWKLGRKCVAGTHNCCELNNYIEYRWYVHEEPTTAINVLSHLSILHDDYWSDISSGNTGTS